MRTKGTVKEHREYGQHCAETMGSLQYIEGSVIASWMSQRNDTDTLFPRVARAFMAYKSIKIMFNVKINK